MSDNADFAGTWDTDYGALNVDVDGDSVTGTYEQRGGSIDGTITGIVVQGTWSQDFTAIDGVTDGDFHLTISSDGTKFIGSWRYGHGAGRWDGTWTGYKTS